MIENVAKLIALKIPKTPSVTRQEEEDMLVAQETG
jgi:hypothetical protein